MFIAILILFTTLSPSVLQALQWKMLGLK